jgi:hypothetical protein
VGRRPDRNPVQRRSRNPEEGRRRLLLRRRERPRPVPDAGEAEIEWGSDHHVLIVQRGTCKLYELYDVKRSGGTWKAGSARSGVSSRTGAAGRLDVGGRRGLPILPGLARYDEVAAGAITHALRFTVQRTRRAYVYPARHVASDLTDPNLPPMGLRLRLRADYPTAGFPRQARIVLEALKRYGMMVADNGSSWYITGAPDPRWSNDDLHTLGRSRGQTSRSSTPRRSILGTVP